MTIAAVIGTGYVGLVTSACLADLGHTVRGVDIREELVAALQRGEVSIYEAGLQPLVLRGLTSGRLSFTTSYRDALAGAELVFVCVDTPTAADGSADVSRLNAAAESIAAAAGERPLTVVIKSTVPVGSARRLSAFFAKATARRSITVVSNPEFLQQGNAVRDFLNPRRIIIGTGDGLLSRELTLLFAPFSAPLVHVNWETAEVAKYAANAFLAAKISFINEIATICEATGADVTKVAAAMGMDPRIGAEFLAAGIGFGGSCLPKDVAALIETARAHGAEPVMLPAIAAVNDNQRRRVVGRLREALGRLDGMRIALFGLAFKPGTDDLRGAPALAVLDYLLEVGADVNGYDPVSRRLAELRPGVPLFADPYEAAADADAVVILTEWPVFRELDWRRIAGAMRGNVVFDARNMLGPNDLAGTGLRHLGIGVPEARE